MNFHTVSLPDKFVFELHKLKELQLKRKKMIEEEHIESDFIFLKKQGGKVFHYKFRV